MEKIELLNDWLKNLVERAINIDTTDSEFNEGLQQGYYECISHLLNQIDGLNLDEILDNYFKEFKPEDIINGNAKNPFDDISS